MLKIRTLLPLLLTVFMAGGSRRGPPPPAEELVEADADNEDEPADPPEAAQPARRRRSRSSTRARRISASRSPRRRPAAAAEGAPDDPALEARMTNMEQQLQQILQAVDKISLARGRDPAEDEEEDDDDEDLVAGAPAPRAGGRPRDAGRRSIPTSDLMAHIPRHSLAWWDNHPAGTPIAYKDLPGQLRQAMDKNPRDRLEVQQTYTALTLSASLLDALVAVTDAGRLHVAQFAMELILNHLFPLLARRVDALQQAGALRSVFMSAQDPRSQYFIADTDTSYGILQKVSSARVQALMTAAGRREENDDRRSNNRRNGTQRPGAGGSPRQQGARDRGAANSRNNNVSSGSSRRGGGNARDRGASSERRGSSRDGAASRSNPADSAARGEDRN